MPSTPKRGKREPKPGTRFPSQVVAGNVRDRRTFARISQEELAERMRSHGHVWVRATVSEVERNGRNVSIDELVSLSLLLGQSIGDLLDPKGVDGRGKDGLDYGGRGFLPVEHASPWARGRMSVQLGDDDAVMIEPMDDFNSVDVVLEAVGARQAAAKKKGPGK